jgi:hypothetical protein
MVHIFDLQRFNEKGKSFKILAFSEKNYRVIPTFLGERPISPYEKPIYGVGFSSGAPPPAGVKKPQ